MSGRYGQPSRKCESAIRALDADADCLALSLKLNLYVPPFLSPSYLLVVCLFI